TPALGVTRTSMPENDSLAAEKRQFIWPVDGWDSANNAFYTGGAHNGSSDISTLYWMPVVAARHGEVSKTPEFSASSGWSIAIAHEQGYSTLYSHLMVKPDLKVGDKVETGTHLGHVGR